MISPLPRRRFRVLSLAPESESDVPRPDCRFQVLLVRKPGTSTGPYSSEEIREALASGKLGENDLAWHKGLANWMPLSTILNSPRTPPGASAGASDPHDDAFYEHLSNIVLAPVTELFRAMDGSDDSAAPQVNANKLEIFLERFPRMAAAFNTRCSTSVAAHVRRSTGIDPVKNTPTERLATEMRETVFKDLDAALWSRRANDGEQRFNQYLAALRDLVVPLIGYASAKCFGTTIDHQKQRACASACSTRCNELIEQATQKFAVSFDNCDSMERRISRFARTQEKRLEGMKVGCVAALILIVGLLVILTTMARSLSDATVAALCIAVAVLSLACASNLLKLLGLWF